MVKLNNLPSANTTRWTMCRKAEVVAAVRNGLLGRDEACERYRLSAEELLNWEQLIAAHGLRGLKVTRLQFDLGKADRLFVLAINCQRVEDISREEAKRLRQKRDDQGVTAA